MVGQSGEKLPTSSKGESGEDWIDEAVKIFGWNVIRFDWWQEAVDRLYYKNNIAILAQTKYKEPRTVYPDTGLEKSRYDRFKEISKDSGLRGIILFTDSTDRVYGQYLDLLREEEHGGEHNKKDNTQMIYFWLKDLRDVKELL